jgi:phospholipid/cholesterol/gamma-HCH transport system substrate-binding protein
METRSNYVMVGAVTLALLVGVLFFIVWLAGFNTKKQDCYDIYFPAISGIDKGSNVTFSGVPVGNVSKRPQLLPRNPGFVWVRIDVDRGTPILEGTTAQIQSISLTGSNEIQLNGAVKGAPPISRVGPQGCPVIPASTSGLSALLNSAPQLLNRIQTLTERLSELLSDKNQNAISDILENLDHTTRALSSRSNDMGAAITNARIALQNAGVAAQRVSALADNTNQLVTDQGKPAVENLNKTIQSVQHAADNLDAVISDARPGIQNFSKSTLPQLNQTVQQMRGLAQSLQQVSDRVNQQGIGGALGPKQLPDYKPGKTR